MSEDVIKSLRLMGMGMLSIFLVIIIIYATVRIMLKVTAEDK